MPSDENSFGPDHPNVARDLGNLVIIDGELLFRQQP
jgi:hypothetical protein